MKLEVRLFAYLRDGRDKKVYMDIEIGKTTVKNIIDTLGIDEEQASILLINGQSVELDATFVEGDYLSLFPPVGGG